RGAALALPPVRGRHGGVARPAPPLLGRLPLGDGCGVCGGAAGVGRGAVPERGVARGGGRRRLRGLAGGGGAGRGAGRYGRSLPVAPRRRTRDRGRVDRLRPGRVAAGRLTPPHGVGTEWSRRDHMETWGLSWAPARPQPWMVRLRRPIIS